MKYTLYNVTGPYRGEQILTPVIDTNDSAILDELFRLIQENKTVTIVKREKDNLLVSVTFRNVEQDRKYMAELVAEVTGKITLTSR